MNPIDNIKKLLEVQERNGAWLARRCGITRQNVHHWMQGSQIPAKYRPIIAAAFGIRQERIWG